MKKALFIILLLILSLSLFAQESIFPEAYKSKKISLNESKITINDLIKKIAIETNENILADNDWRVLEREVVIYGKDVALCDVLDSIHVITKLIWVKDNDKYILKYDPDTDLYISQLNAYSEQKQVEARKKILDNYFKDDENVDIEALKKNDPLKYLNDATGLTKTIGGMVDNIEGVRGALENGQAMSINCTDLSDEAYNNISLTQSISQDFMQDLANKNQHVDKEIRRLVNKNRKSQIPEDKSRVTIEVNNHYNKDFKDFLVGNMEIKVDGKSVGDVTFFNTQNPMVKQFGSIFADMYDNNNFDPKAAFAEMVSQNFFQNLSSSVNKDEFYDSFKVPMPNLPIFKENVNLGAKPASKMSAMELLSKGTGKLCICDDYSNFVDNLPLTNIEIEAPLEEIINGINNTYGLTMIYENGNFYFYSIRWFEEIQKLMPKVYFEKWAAQYEKDEFISLDNLYEMAMFSEKQLKYGLSKNPSLNMLCDDVTRKLDTLVFLTTIEKTAYDKLTSEKGIYLLDISKQSQENLIKIKEFKNVFNLGNPLIKAKFEKFDDKEVLSLIATDGNNNIINQINLKKFNKNPMNFDFLNKTNP